MDEKKSPGEYMLHLLNTRCFLCSQDDREKQQCSVLYKRYFELGKKECSAYVEEFGELERLNSVVRYARMMGQPAPAEVIARIHRLEPVGDWKIAYLEDVHNRHAKPGGGEKNDRTHKLFGKARMKDNRLTITFERPRGWKS